jgi:hypothetical protein
MPITTERQVGLFIEGMRGFMHKRVANIVIGVRYVEGYAGSPIHGEAGLFHRKAEVLLAGHDWSHGTQNDAEANILVNRLKAAMTRLTVALASKQRVVKIPTAIQPEICYLPSRRPQRWLDRDGCQDCPCWHLR